MNKLCTAVLAMLLAAAPAAYPQAFSQLTGTVADSTGATVPGAEVTASNQDTGVERTAQTNASGSYPGFPI